MYKIIGIIVVIIIALSAGWFIYNDINKSNSLKDNPVATSTDDVAVDIKNDEISDTVINTGMAMPDLNKIIVFYNELPEDAKTILTEKITKQRSNLKENNDLFSEWLSLGVNYKIAGDYESARNAWEYASVIRPKSSVPLLNLADLYHFYLKDFQKAEEKLLIVIGNDEQKITAYTMLHELYKYSYKQDTTLAVDILLEGIAENSENIDILVTLAAYYKETNDNINAKKYYEQARDEAQKLGNIQLAELLEEEISNL